MLFEFEVDGQVLRIDPDPRKLTGAELLAVERHTGMAMVDFGEALMNPRGSAAAVAALVWIARRRSGDFVKWDDFIETLHPLTLELRVIDDTPEGQPSDSVADVAPMAGSGPSKPRSRARAPRAKAT